MTAPERTVSSQNRMRNSNVVVEWKISEDDREWHLDQNATLAASTPTPLGRRGWTAIACAFLCLLISMGWLWHQANSGLIQIEEELQVAADTEQWRTEQGSRNNVRPGSTAQVITAGEQLPSDAQVQLLKLGEDWALVQVITPRGEISYRQTRFYRRGENGWYVADPIADVWGAPRKLRTTHFTFHYFSLDTAAVEEAAATIEALYAEIVVSNPFDALSVGKQEIWVSPEYPLVGTVSESANPVLKMASPGIYLAPADISEAEILAQAVLLHLLDVLSTQSLEQQLLRHALHDDLFTKHMIESRLHALLEGLKLWQLWNTELPLASLYRPTMRWVYNNSQQSYVPPEYAPQLCPLHQLWQGAPYLIQVPLLCGDPQLLHRYEVGRHFPHDAPRRLAEIRLYTNTTPDEPYNLLVESERFGLVTLFDYVAATYGRESIATLVANAASQSNWETVIPSTFDIPFEEFERGWQAHLRSRYGVADPITQ